MPCRVLHVNVTLDESSATSLLHHRLPAYTRAPSPSFLTCGRMSAVRVQKHESPCSVGVRSSKSLSERRDEKGDASSEKCMITEGRKDGKEPRAWCCIDPAVMA
ncbi:uncharacterized [Tachysurus ichikawai]